MHKSLRRLRNAGSFDLGNTGALADRRGDLGCAFAPDRARPANATCPFFWSSNPLSAALIAAPEHLGAIDALSSFLHSPYTGDRYSALAHNALSGF